MKEMIEKFIASVPLNGSKAYLAGIGMIVWAVLCLSGVCQCHDETEIVFLVGNGLGLIGLRHALSKAQIEKIVKHLPHIIALIQEIRGRQLDPDLEPTVGNLKVEKE